MKMPSPPNFDGPKGETIFSSVIRGDNPENIAAKIGEQAEKNIEHISSFNDDRVLAIHGAILVENTLDSLLDELFPKFSKVPIRDHFGPKLQLLKSFKIIPSRLINAANLIKKIRNEFAHNLNFKKLNDLPDKMVTVKTSLNEFYEDYPGNDSLFEEYRALIMTSSMSLAFYKSNLQAFNNYIRSENFESEVENFAT
ncbi:MAG: hypothetical protein ACQETL_19235 [Bacteroidota bacterium]